MRKLLLDTHAWVWWILGSEKLGTQATAALEASRGACWLSPISVWEIGVLVEKGRLVPERPYRVWVEAGVRSSGVKTAPLSHEIAMRSHEISLPHRDPADRLIAATALEAGLTLVTADERLRCVEGLPTLDAAS
jgi:PIN domain nuclease of toxin-antitoxin system